MYNRSRFQMLFAPGQIGKMTIRNRIIMSPMGTRYATDDGFITKKQKDYFEDRAKGGAGLIITEASCVDFPEGYLVASPRIDEDRFIPGLCELTEVIHRHGAKAAAQLTHIGPASIPAGTHMQPVAASPIGRPPDYTHATYYEEVAYALPRELTIKEIKTCITRFAKGVERAKKSGFDGVEISAGHRYLLNSFISPAWNRRQDNYGGHLRNRARLLLDIISASRELVGPDYPLWCRINAEEREIDGGITIEIAKELAQLLEEAGVDAIDVSMMYPHSPEYPQGFIVDAAAEIKKVVKIPVIVVGRIEAGHGEKILRQEKADFICIGRGLIADPELPNKAASGRIEDIYPCLYCCSCLGPKPRICTVNPAIFEGRFDITPAEKARNVLVVGGGPGGLEAARVAALRGHNVTLYEKDRRLGGQVKLASVPREENGRIVKYLETQVKKLGVKVEMGKEVDLETVKKLNPDVILLATGSVSSLPEIPGIDRDNVISASDIQMMMDGRFKRAGTKRRVGLRRRLWYLGIMIMRIFGSSAMRRLLNVWTPFGRRVIIVGLGLPGVELADFLVQHGKRVTLVGTYEVLYPKQPMPVYKVFLEQRLARNGIVKVNADRYEWITDKGLTIIDKQGRLQTIQGDTIVFAADYKPNTELTQALAGTSYHVHNIGDCVEPVGIHEAIRDGSSIGRTI